MEDFAGILYAIVVILILISLWYSGIFDIIKSLSKGVSPEQAKQIGKDVGAGSADAIIGLGKGLITGIKENAPPARHEGEACGTHADCEGWAPSTPGTLACCNGRCEKQIKDWANIGWCPMECKDSPTSALGTCGTGFHWPRLEGEKCSTHTDCNGWSPTTPGTLACCGGTCAMQLADWAGVGYCNVECKDSPTGALGTCSRGFHWPRRAGEQCSTNEDCDGFKPGSASLACDKGTCVQQKKDWAGVWYKPSECVGAIFGKPGTC